MWVIAAFGAALGFGTFLRVYGLREQVLVDDEWHGLHHLLRVGYRGILTRFSLSGDSIPLIVAYRVLADTVGLSELGMRVPSLLAGVASMALLPTLWPRGIRDGERVAFAWLMALSPILVFFSRYARPYSITLFLSTVGVLAFYRWWRGGRSAWVVVFAGCGTMAPYFSLASGPGVVAPLVFATLDCTIGRTAERTLRDLAPLVAGIAAGTAPLLVILGHGPGPVVSKLFVEPIGRIPLRGIGEFLVGTTNLPLILCALACLLLGARRLCLQNRHLVCYLATVVVLQVSGVLFLRPNGLQYGIVFARYCLPALPILLLFVALGARRLDALMARPLPLASACLLGGLLLTGPLPRIYYWPNNFTNHGSLQFDYDHGDYFERFRPPVISRFYQWLRQESSGTWRIVEAPWYYYWHSYPYYQRHHRQWVLVGAVDPRPERVRDGELPRGRAGLRFENLVHVADHDTIRARGVDFVIFHADLVTEMDIPFPSVPVSTRRWIDEYEHRFGSPVFADERVTVFAVSPAARSRHRRRALRGPTLLGD